MTPDVQHMTTPEILLIISGIATAICSIIAALKTSSTGRKVDDAKLHLSAQDQKLDSIHTQTNGNLIEMKAQMELLRRENAELKAAREAKAQAEAELAAEVRRHQPVVIADRRSTSPRRTKRRA